MLPSDIYLSKGIGGVLAGHPIDTIKVRLQNQTSDNMKYKGTIHCMRTIVKEETVGACGCQMLSTLTFMN